MGIAALKHEILVLLGLAHERSGCICFFMAVLTSYTRTYVYTMSDLFLHGLQLLQARLAIPLPTLFHPHSHRFDTIHQYIYLNQFILPFIASLPTLAFVLFKISEPLRCLYPRVAYVSLLTSPRWWIWVYLVTSPPTSLPRMTMIWRRLMRCPWRNLNLVTPQ